MKQHDNRRFFEHRLRQAQWVSLFFVLLFVAVGCAQINEPETVEAIDTRVYKDLIFPVLWMDSTEGMYQPTFPTKTQLTLESIPVEGAFFSETGIDLIYNSEEDFKVTYTYYTHLGMEIESGESVPEEIGIEQGRTLHIPGFSGIDPQENESYILEVIVQKGATMGYAYFPLVYTTKISNTTLIQQVYVRFQQYLQDNNESLMGEPKISIHGTKDNNSLIQITFTGAQRLEEGFDYKDITLTYRFDFSQNTYSLDSVSKIDKQRYVYSNLKGGWDMGGFLLNDESNDSRVVVESENNRYKAIYDQKEIVLYDTKKEELKEVYRIDRFDSEYVTDEYTHHQIHLFDVTDEGEVYFAVEGYINDTSKNKQMTGIAFYHYDNTTLDAIGIIEKGEAITKLEAFVNHNVYYSKTNSKYYIFERSMLYSLDCNTGQTEYIETFFDAKIDTDYGLLYWKTGDSKLNGSINSIDLDEKTLVITNIYTTGLYKQLLGIDKNTLIVGGYALEDTYEQLDGDILTPFNQILVYDFEGKLQSEYNQPATDSNQFFSDIYFDESTEKWLSDSVERQFEQSDNHKNSRIRFNHTGNTIEIIQRSKEPDRMTQLELVTNDSVLVTQEAKSSDIIFMKKITELTTKKMGIDMLDMPPNNFYLLEDSKGVRSYSSEFVKALQLAEDKLNYTISYVSYTSDKKWDQRILFESSSLKSEIMIDNVKVIPQRPELPRGCEVTSLSVLLDYYMENAPDKTTLSTQIKQSTVERTVVDGFVQFSNMHEEFAGSMNDVAKDGLGVYIGPIRQLAQSYVGDHAVDITGVSFKQLLTFLSLEKPILIIISNRYQAVSDYAKEVWKTPSGYMEVTYQEHSVVLIGFDEDYIYYSDPSKGIIDKKPKNTFEAAWVSMGSQGMIIQD